MTGPITYAVIASVITASLTVMLLMSSAPGGGGKGESGFEVAQLRVESAALRGELDDVKRAVRSQRPSSASAPVGTDDSSLPPILRMFGKAPPNRPSAVKRDPKPNEGRWGSGPDQFYDGRTDAKHLGGSTGSDRAGLSPGLWTFILKAMNVRSIVDVGCGRGISTKWFLDHGADVLCVEGANDAINKSYLPRDKIVAHDFSLGPWWPDKTYDMAWCIEVLEHIARPYMYNYQTIFHKAAIIVASHSAWGGHHHVEVHPDWWWITRMELAGFIYSDVLTQLFRKLAQHFSKGGGEAQHIVYTSHVYINPKVSSLPEHAHIMGMFGCYSQWPGKEDGKLRQNGPCGDPEDALPEKFLPVHRTPTHYDKYDLEWGVGGAIGTGGATRGTSEFDLSLTNLPDAKCLEQTWPKPTRDDGCEFVGKPFDKKNLPDVPVE